MDIQDIANHIVKNAIQRGCDLAEVFVRRARGMAAEAKNGEIEALESSVDFGLAIRVVRGGKLGFSFATDLNDTNRTLTEAVESSQWTSGDQQLNIPDEMSPRDVHIFDDKINALKEDDLMRDALLLEEGAINFDKRITKVRKAEVHAGTGETTIVNSKGICITYRGSRYAASVTAIAQNGSGDSQMGWDYASSRKMDDVTIAAVGSGAAKNTIELLGARRISPVRVPVILSRPVAVNFIEILSMSISAEAVQKRRSFLRDKINKVVTSTMIDIVDDGTFAWKNGTCPVDDEGVPTETTTLVSKGTLCGYLHNSYTARKDGVCSTGNAVRRNITVLPGVGISNLFVSPTGNRTEQDMVKSLSKGILVRGAMGVHTANPVSGDFSVGLSGLWIENGEVVYPVKEAVISGNILDMFRKVEDVGCDISFYGKIGSPSLLIGEMDISA